MSTPSPLVARLSIKVVPGSSRNRVAGWLGEELKVTVSAPPESGKANAAVEAVIADLLGVPSKSVLVATGHTRPRKVLEIAGMSSAELDRHLAEAGFPGPGK